MADIVFDQVDVIYLGRKKTEYQALNKFSCHFHDGKINAVVGYSGCGKTTLLRVLTGQVNYGGNVLINNKEADEMSIQDKNISIVHQNYSLYPRMSVFDNLAFVLKNLKYSPNEITTRVYETAKFLKISHCLARKPKELSGGQQQRVAIGKAIIKRPDIILFDEPLSNVDVESRTDILKFIKELSTKYGVTCIYVTHNMNEAMSIADDVFVMNEGKLELDIEPKDLLTSDNEIVKNLLKDATNNEE